MNDDTKHIATAAAALDDPYAALSQHLHGDGDEDVDASPPTKLWLAGGNVSTTAPEHEWEAQPYTRDDLADPAWRPRALAAEAEVERLRAAIPERDAEVRRAALEEAAQAVCRAAWKHEGHDEYSRGLDRGAVTQNEQDYLAIRALIDAPPQAADTCATDGCTNPPVIRLDDRRLCRDCYAAHDLGRDA